LTRESVNSSCSISFGAEKLLLYGTEEQKKKYLPPIFKSEAIMGFAITEPDAGSDTAAASTTAVKDGNEYVINGNKVMIGNGTVGTFLLVYWLTNPEEKSKTARHSSIIVETDRKGYDAGRMEGKMGLRCSDTSNVYFTDVRVLQENLLGKEEHGFIRLMHFFDRSRAYVAGHGVGLAQGALDMAIAQARERRQFGHSPSELSRLRSSKLPKWRPKWKPHGSWCIRSGKAGHKTDRHGQIIRLPYCRGGSG